MYVSEIMSTRVVTAQAAQSVYEAARLMEDNNIGAIPVVEGSELKGMLTDRDIVLRCVAKGENPKSVRTGDIMTEKATYVTPSQLVDDAAQVMSCEQIRRLPVVENGRVTGMVSVADIARLRHGVEIAQAICEISKP